MFVLRPIIIINLFRCNLTLVFKSPISHHAVEQVFVAFKIFAYYTINASCNVKPLGLCSYTNTWNIIHKTIPEIYPFIVLNQDRFVV